MELHRQPRQIVDRTAQKQIEDSPRTTPNQQQLTHEYSACVLLIALKPFDLSGSMHSRPHISAANRHITQQRRSPS